MSSNLEQNLQRALELMERAKRHGAEAVCFPEVQLSPFFPQHPGQEVSHYAIAIDHPAMQALRDKCQKLSVVGFPNIYLQENEKCYDASPVIDADGTLLGISKMVHIAQLPCFYEQDYYTPSDTGFIVYDTAVGKIGVVICFDRHLPESIRCCARQGAKLVVIPTANTRAEPSQMFEWEMRVAAMQNGVFIAMCNRVGIEDEMDFCGESIVVDPDGNLVEKADSTEQILYADIDLDQVEESQQARPYLSLLRPECYHLPI